MRPISRLNDTLDESRIFWSVLVGIAVVCLGVLAWTATCAP